MSAVPILKFELRKLKVTNRYFISKKRSSSISYMFQQEIWAYDPFAKYYYLLKTFVTQYIEFETIYVFTSVRNSVLSTRSEIYKVETIQSKQLRNEPNLLFRPQTLSLAFYQRQVCVNVYFERSPKSFVFFLDKDYRSIAPALSCNSLREQ